jgi:hypothetical protein
MLRGEDSATSVSRNVMISMLASKCYWSLVCSACRCWRWMKRKATGAPVIVVIVDDQDCVGRSQWKEPVRIMLVLLPLRRRGVGWVWCGVNNYVMLRVAPWRLHSICSLFFVRALIERRGKWWGFRYSRCQSQSKCVCVQFWLRWDGSGGWNNLESGLISVLAWKHYWLLPSLIVAITDRWHVLPVDAEDGWNGSNRCTSDSGRLWKKPVRIILILLPWGNSGGVRVKWSK